MNPLTGSSIKPLLKNHLSCLLQQEQILLSILQSIKYYMVGQNTLMVYWLINATDMGINMEIIMDMDISMDISMDTSIIIIKNIKSTAMSILTVISMNTTIIILNKSISNLKGKDKIL